MTYIMSNFQLFFFFSKKKIYTPHFPPISFDGYFLDTNELQLSVHPEAD